MSRAGRLSRVVCLAIIQPTESQLLPSLRPPMFRWSTVIRPMVTTVTPSLTKAIKQGNLDQARVAFETILQDKAKVSHSVVSKLLLLARKGKKPGDLAFMSRIVSVMETTPDLAPTLFDYHALMYAYGIHRRPDDAYALLARMRARDIEPSVYSYNILIGCYKRAHEFKKAASIFESMPVAPDVTTFNTMIHLFRQLDRPEKALTLYARMTSLNVQADKYTYSAILPLAANRDRELGNTVYSRLLEQPNTIDTATFNTMLQFKQGNLNEMLDLYYALPTTFSHVRADLVTFNLLMNACLKASNPAKASLMFRDMQLAGIQPDIVTYGTMIAAEANNGDLEGALTLLDEMDSRSIPVTERILGSLANVAGSRRTSKMALQRFAATVRQHHSQGVRLGTMAYNSLLHGLAKHGCAHEVHQLYNDVFRQGECRADVATFTSMILAYINDDKLDDAMDIYYQLRDRQRAQTDRHNTTTLATLPSLDVVFYTSIISALTRLPDHLEDTETSWRTASLTDGHAIQGDTTPALLMALTLFQDMRQARIRPNAHAYATVLHACGRNRDTFVLEQIHNLIKVDLYFDPDTVVYNALMDAYNRVGDGGTVLRIWDTLYLSSSFDNATISIVLDSCGHNGQSERARRLWKLLRRNKVPLNANNMSSYVECLCRARGREGWDEAKQLVLDALDKESIRLDRQPVDKKTVNTLISFARKKGFSIEEIEKLETWKASLCLG